MINVNYTAIQKLLANELLVLEAEYRMFRRISEEAYSHCNPDDSDKFYFTTLNQSKDLMRKNKVRRKNIAEMLKEIKCWKKLQSEC
jgi:hypothetical protein